MNAVLALVVPAPPAAHFGHVLVDLPIFFGPVLVLTIWLVVVSRRDR